MKLGNNETDIKTPQAAYNKAEEALLRKALSSSYTERFHAMTRLMKLNIMLNIHKKHN